MKKGSAVQCGSSFGPSDRRHHHTTTTTNNNTVFVCCCCVCLGGVFDSAVRVSSVFLPGARLRSEVDKPTSRAGRAYFCTSGSVFAAVGIPGAWGTIFFFWFLIVLPKTFCCCFLLPQVGAYFSSTSGGGMLARGALWFNNATYGMAYTLLFALVVLQRRRRGPSRTVTALHRAIYSLCAVRFVVASAMAFFLASEFPQDRGALWFTFDGLMALNHTTGDAGVIVLWTELCTVSVLGSVWLVADANARAVPLGWVVALVVLSFFSFHCGAGFVGYVLAAAVSWWRGTQRSNGHESRQKLIADTPRPPYVAVIFSSVRSSSDDGTYSSTAKRMLQLAVEQPGFLGVESAREALGITVSYWSSLQAVHQWKRNAEHREVQETGRRLFYDGFKVRVAMVQRDYGMVKWE